MGSLTCSLDGAGDVLYVRAPNTAIYASAPIAGDDFVILNMDRDGRVVGVQVIDVKEMSAARWRECFHTREIPEDLFLAVYEFLAGKQPASDSRLRTTRTG